VQRLWGDGEKLAETCDEGAFGYKKFLLRRLRSWNVLQV
jgi:hypothetical protein